MCIQLGKYVSRVTRDDVIASTRMDAWLTALEDRFVEKCTLIGWWAWQSVCNYFMSDWVDTNAEFSDYVCLTPDVPSFVDRRRVSDHVEMYVNRVDFWKITYRFMSQNDPERTKNIH